MGIPITSKSKAETNLTAAQAHGKRYCAKKQVAANLLTGFMDAEEQRLHQGATTSTSLIEMAQPVIAKIQEIPLLKRADIADAIMQGVAACRFIAYAKELRRNSIFTQSQICRTLKAE